jgi:hypothetical protein
MSKLTDSQLNAIVCRYVADAIHHELDYREPDQRETRADSRKVDKLIHAYAIKLYNDAKRLDKEGEDG